jgi:hypothetical protein
MEVMLTWRRMIRCIYLCRCMILLLLAVPLKSMAQEPPVKHYSIRDGKMYITLSKKISEPSLDSFINQYALNDLDLKGSIKTNTTDSLKKLGWKIDINNGELLIISKLLMGINNINNVADKIIFTEKDAHAKDIFSPESSSIIYGINRFKNKYAFAVSDSVVTFFLRKHLDAKRVILSGSFVNWSPDNIVMIATDSGWIAQVKLGPGKYWYKFIIDGNWDIDNDNQLKENDGEGNVNSVFYKTNTVFKLNDALNAKKVYLAGSFNNWDGGQLQMKRTATGWELPVYLANGTYTYRFVTDGNWQYDAANPERVRNEFDDYNSVVHIGKSYLFKLDGYTNAKQVILAGSFNDWRKYEFVMDRTATGWELPYTLGPGNYEYQFFVDGKGIKDPANDPYKQSDNSYFIINPNYTFHLKAYPNAKTIFLSGDFNNWSPATFAMKKDGDEWVFTVHLSPGKHLYKFVVDGKWIIDPGNKLWEQNEFDTGNSVLWINNK